MHTLPTESPSPDRGRARMWCVRDLPRSRSERSNDTPRRSAAPGNMHTATTLCPAAPSPHPRPRQASRSAAARIALAMTGCWCASAPCG
jgi:hypothetical protein